MRSWARRVARTRKARPAPFLAALLGTLASSPSVALAQPSEAEPAVEITVQGERSPPSAESLTREEARSIPGAFGDPARAVEALPGVAPVVSGLPYVFVRGAPPGNVGYFIDGIRVPLLWHAFFGPSVLNPATIERVTLHRGGYPARFGRYAGGIINVESTVPLGETRGEAALRVVDAGVMQTFPLSSDGRSTALVSGRYAYLGPAVSRLSSDTEIGYWDYQLSSEIDLGASDTLSLLVLGANDDLASDTFESHVRFHRIDPRYRHRFSDATQLSTGLTFGLDHTGSENGSLDNVLVAPRVEVEHHASKQVTVRVGADASFDRYELAIGEGLRYRALQTLQALGTSRNERTFGAYVELGYQPGPGVWLWPGVRADLWSSPGVSEQAVDPRIAARFQATETIAFEHTLGVAHQSASFVPGIPGASITSTNEGLQRSVQASSSVELRLPEQSLVSVTAFDAIYTNLADPLGTEHRLALDADQLLGRVSGHAYGLEFFYKRPLFRQLGALVSYTLSRSTRSYGRIATLASIDRTHVVSATVVYNPTPAWQLSARNTFHSGLPTRRATNDGPLFDGSDRSEPFYRLDLRGERRFKLGTSTSLSVVAELLNATFSHEVTERSCNDTGCTEAGVGPIVIPNLGLELRY
jgi:hypothetical protein